jgi:hypothetical protein
MAKNLDYSRVPTRQNNRKFLGAGVGPVTRAHKLIYLLRSRVDVNHNFKLSIEVSADKKALVIS